MDDYLPQFQIKTKPAPNPNSVVISPRARFTVLTPRVIRLEYSASDQFENHASQVFWFREQVTPEFSVRRKDKLIEIKTSYISLKYREGKKGFNKNNITVELLKTGTIWHYGDKDSQNLHGTTRTLDQSSGSVKLEDGLLSRSGWTVVDDSGTLVFNEKGWLVPRTNPKNKDLYFFGYGKDYPGCLQDFYLLSGVTPMIPRWFLGNWWSRFWSYSQEDLTNLVEDFKKYEIPLSICIIDMDWHIVRKKGKSFWTGYTWNNDLFPDPEKFIQWLHKHGVRTALNLHPAGGIQPHESQYATFAHFMGRETSSKQPIEFDCADPHFIRGYFEILHHPYEKKGVDFWWVDWQQGKKSKLTGLDPLWWLNHLHFFDLGRNGKKRPVVFSRWGGLGNHRYPIGFSGDTHVTWESLAFQPYFTATAANVGYGWWSHDIGGHMLGTENPELFVRWIQWGVFSPIMRLHSTNNPYQERRPWKQGAENLRIIREAMQLRHRLIPYIYTMAWRDYTEGKSLISPMYHQWPDDENAYACPNQYSFGTEMVASPYTSPKDPDTNMSRQTFWFPPGEWFNFFSDKKYKGNQWVELHGLLDEIPVFAKAGAIVPMGPQVTWGGVENPTLLQIHIFPGLSNHFELYEDDGLTNAYLEGHYSLLPFDIAWDHNKIKFIIGPVKGMTSHLPSNRSFELIFHKIAPPEKIISILNNKSLKTTNYYDKAEKRFHLQGVNLPSLGKFSLILQNNSSFQIIEKDEKIVEIRRYLRIFNLSNEVKLQVDEAIPKIIKSPQSIKSFVPRLKVSQIAAILSLLS